MDPSSPGALHASTRCSLALSEGAGCGERCACSLCRASGRDAASDDLIIRLRRVYLSRTYRTPAWQIDDDQGTRGSRTGNASPHDTIRAVCTVCLPRLAAAGGEKGLPARWRLPLLPRPSAFGPWDGVVRHAALERPGALPRALMRRSF